MSPAIANPVVHLELRTADLPGACAFYTQLFGWRVESVHVGARSYLALELGDAIGGGVVERRRAGAAWLPYVEVVDAPRVCADAIELGAAMLVEPREGAAGWRSVLATPDGGHVGLWQPKL